ncbi:DUF3182 family protein [Stutzerimonas tarimensis]|uniref:DUF3182 family protein n=1 Tax=Stutzerimonas tarimensis TaxID=1507735 RepID=A0ABV7T0D6_9GAMM
MSAADLRRKVCTFPNRVVEPEHERVVHRLLAERLARLTGTSFAGDYSVDRVPAQGAYLVPSATLVGLDEAARVGVTSERDLFGGVVPHAFIATKAITHPLVDPQARAPLGWSTAFGERVEGSVLEGYSAFSMADAEQAGRRLLAGGALRVKPVNATAGRGQVRIDNETALIQALHAIDSEEVEKCGLVLERHLEQVATISVGQVRIGERVISYHGTQRLTTDNSGEQVYGGSDLWVVQGGFEDLLALDLSESVRLAVEQARCYDEAASGCYPGFFASRRNYDVACGVTPKGRRCSGVLEQSWRIGGASSAEIFALEMLGRPGGPERLCASSVEIYGEGALLPDGATVLYQGQDAHVGPISKCVTLEDYGDPV